MTSTASSTSQATTSTPTGVPLLPMGRSGLANATGVIAIRRAVDGQIPATRLLTRGVSDLKVGSTLVTHHAKNHLPCGTWNVVAILVSGKVTAGKLPEGVTLDGASIRVNRIG